VFEDREALERRESLPIVQTTIGHLEEFVAAPPEATVFHVEFNITDLGPHVISPVSPLPFIVDPVLVNGGSNPDFMGSPVIEIDGTGAGANGLVILGGNSIVSHLAINRFDGHGIVLATNGGNFIESSYIGTDITGSLDRGKGQHGVFISESSNNVIGGSGPGEGNVISGNGSMGVRISGSGSTGNRIEGNLIGTDRSGTVKLGNSDRGVDLVGG